jgi:methylase of polypeptide subunit release factors
MLNICISITNAVQRVCKPSRRLRVVEFCAGSGFIGIPLAAIYPEIDVTLIDQKVSAWQV